MQGMVNPLGNRRGLTLVELLVSGTLAAMVLVAAVALSLAVFDATLEDPDAILLEADARRFELLLRGDVSRAVDVVSLTPWALDLLAADGDTIRYAWDGVPGSDVTRTIAAVTGVVAAEVDSLRFQALTATQPLTTETFGLTEIVGTAVSYDFGDLTAYTDTTGCWNYSMGTNKIQGRYQVGVTFDATADHDTLITASVRVAAIDQFPRHRHGRRGVHGVGSGRAPGHVAGERNARRRQRDAGVCVARRAPHDDGQRRPRDGSLLLDPASHQRHGARLRRYGGVGGVRGLHDG